MILDSTNKQGDTIEIHGDGIVLNHSYWECECGTYWIKPITLTSCPKCNAHKSDCANAREQEVQEFIYHTKR